MLSWCSCWERPLHEYSISRRSVRARAEPYREWHCPSCISYIYMYTSTFHLKLMSNDLARRPLKTRLSVWFPSTLYNASCSSLMTIDRGRKTSMIPSWPSSRVHFAVLPYCVSWLYIFVIRYARPTVKSPTDMKRTLDCAISCFLNPSVIDVLKMNYTFNTRLSYYYTHMYSLHVYDTIYYV